MQIKLPKQIASYFVCFGMGAGLMSVACAVAKDGPSACADQLRYCQTSEQSALAALKECQEMQPHLQRLKKNAEGRICVCENN